MSRPKRLNPNSFSHFITAQLFAGAHQGVFHRFGGAVQQLGCLGGGVPLQLASRLPRSRGESCVLMRSSTAAQRSLAMASSSGPGAAEFSGRGTLLFSGACFLRLALRRASCCALAIQAAAYAVKGTFYPPGSCARHGTGQSALPAPHLQSQGRYCNGSSTFAYGRHHGGDQRGNSAFLPSLCLLQQLVIHLLRHGYFPPWINAIVLILPFNAAFVNKILPCTLNNPFLKRGICRTVLRHAPTFL